VLSQFEFLPSVFIGQYLPIDSILHRLDPRARMIATIALVMAFTFSTRLEGIALGILAIMIALRVGKIPHRYVIRGLSTPLPFLLILAVLQVFINPHHPGPPVLISFWLFHISLADLLTGVILLFRFTGLILTFSLASYTLSTSEMTQGLNALLLPLARLKLPVQDVVMMVQVTLRFLPLLALTAERIAKAQASRGADWDAKGGNLAARVRQILPIIVPLFMSSLHRAEAMALAMDARAYGSSPARTSFVEFKFQPRDGLLIALAGLVTASILFV
jgi:energy-coupling factor transport system permease protein